ncbi:BON domain-containing protein [Aquabacterium sp. A08]|nr:BON domain-containing protein [Aquabacterium sp. A08]
MDDTAITAKVKTAIFNDAALKSAEINVETFKGVVQLSGFVNSATDIQHAVKLVQTISGVRAVRNDMRLK